MGRALKRTFQPPDYNLLQIVAAKDPGISLDLFCELIAALFRFFHITTGVHHGYQKIHQSKETRPEEVMPDRLSLFSAKQKGRRESAFLFCPYAF